MQPIIHAYTLFVTQHALFNITLYRKSIIKYCFLHKPPLDGTIHLGGIAELLRISQHNYHVTRSKSNDISFGGVDNNAVLKIFVVAICL